MPKILRTQQIAMCTLDITLKPMIEHGFVYQNALHTGLGSVCCEYDMYRSVNIKFPKTDTDYIQNTRHQTDKECNQ